MRCVGYGATVTRKPAKREMLRRTLAVGAEQAERREFSPRGVRDIAFAVLA